MYDALFAESITITGHGGDSIEAYSARPLDSAPRGGVVAIHHMPGYDVRTKEIARKFADQGYNAAMPNLYCREAPGATPDYVAVTARAKGGVPDERPGRRRGRGRFPTSSLTQRQRQGRHHRLLLRRPPVGPGRRQRSSSTWRWTATAPSSPGDSRRASRWSRSWTSPGLVLRRCSASSAPTTSTRRRPRSTNSKRP